MKILLTGDLHYGFSKKTRKILEEFFANISTLDFDVLIINGDLVSCRQRDLSQCFELIRYYLPSVPILYTFGNHDWWDISNYKCQSMPFNKILDFHKKVMLKYDIIDLHNEPYRIDDIFIYGVDSWYGLDTPPTNDFKWLPFHIHGNDTFTELRNRFYHHMWWKHVPIDCTKVVAVSHFHALTGHPMEMSAEQFREFVAPANLILVGHDHIPRDYCHYDNKRYVNCGSDYDAPKYKVVEI